MQTKKFRWSKVYESSEEELIDFLQGRDITTVRRKMDDFALIKNQKQDTAKTFYVAEGSATFTIDSISYSMQPGDGLTVPPGLKLSINSGMTGCVYFETSR